MAVTAKFTADFSSFIDAIDKAEIALVDFGKGANKVETSLNRMVDNFSGRKLIQEASLMTIAVEKAGGVSTLTAKELQAVGSKADEAADKLRRLGIEVPPGMQKLADSIKQIQNESTKTTNVLSGLEQQLLGMFSIGAVIAFGREILDAGDKIEKMSDQTGLSRAEVQKLQFVAGQSGVAIESLIGAVQNLQVRLGDDNTGAAGAMAKLRINAEAFNKLTTYEQLLALSDAIRSVQDPTEQASIAAALFGKTWKEILPAIKSGMKEVGDQATIMSDETVKSLDRIGDTLKGARQAAIAFGGGFVTAIEGAAFAVGDFFSQFSPDHFGTTNSELLKIAGLLNDPDGLKGALVAAEAGASKLNKTFGALPAMGIPKNLKDIEDGLNADHKAITEADKAAEKFAQTLAETLRKADEQFAQQRIAGINSIEKAEKDLADFQAKQALDTLSYQVLKIWERVDEEEKSFKGSEEQRAQYNKAVEQLATEEAQALVDASNKAIIQAAELSDATEKSANKQVAAIAKVTQGYWAEVDAAFAAIAAASGGLDSSTGTRTTTPNDGTQERGPGINLTPTVPINGFARGGPTGRGGLAMLHAGEFVVPKDGALVSGSGGPQIIQLVVDGRVLAEVVEARQTKSMKTSRQFPAS